jgi:hypothetical protein
MVSVPMAVVVIVIIVIAKAHKGWDVPQIIFGMISRSAFDGTILDGPLNSLSTMFTDAVNAVVSFFQHGGHGAEGVLRVAAATHAVLAAHGLVG